MTYNFEKKQHEQEIIQEQKDQLKKIELTKQKIIKNTFLVGFILTILLAFLIFRSYRLKYKANILLEDQKIRINQQKEEIISKNKELTQQKEEIIIQRDLLDDTNKELGMINVYLGKLTSVNKDRNVAVSISNNKGKIEWINDGFIKLYGYTKDEYIFRCNSILDRNENKPEILENINNNNSYSYDAEFKSKSEESKKIKVILIPILDKANQLIKIVSVETEISEKISV